VVAAVATAFALAACTSVLDRVSANGSVDTATALQAFSLAFGPLPGGPGDFGCGGEAQGSVTKVS
jgi:hypothetical protein